MDSQIFVILGWIFSGGMIVFLVGVLTLRFVIKSKREEANQSVLRTDTATLQLNDNLRSSLDQTIDQLAKYAEIIAQNAKEKLETENQLKACLQELKDSKNK